MRRRESLLCESVCLRVGQPAHGDDRQQVHLLDIVSSPQFRYWL